MTARASDPKRYMRRCPVCRREKSFTLAQLEQRYPCPDCRPLPERRCAICDTPFRARIHAVPTQTCASPDCRRIWANVRRLQRLSSQPQPTTVTADALRDTDDPGARWERPIPPPDRPPIVTTPPRRVVLPDGTEAEVVWSGDMVTSAGCKGGLLPERRSAGDPISRMAPDWSGVWLTSAEQRQTERARSQARRQRQKRQVAA